MDSSPVNIPWMLCHRPPNLRASGNDAAQSGDGVRPEGGISGGERVAMREDGEDGVGEDGDGGSPMRLATTQPGSYNNNNSNNNTCVLVLTLLHFCVLII